MLKNFWSNFSEENKKYTILEIVLCCIVYLIFEYPDGGFKLNSYLFWFNVSCLINILIILFIHYCNEKSIIIFGREFIAGNFLRIIILNFICLTRIFSMPEFVAGFIVVGMFLNYLFLKIDKRKRIIF